MENNGQQAGKTSATVGDLRKQEGDLLYAMVLCFTFGQMGLIVWDMFALIPEFEELIGVPNPGRIHSFVEMTTLYLAFIGAYIGRNAWRKYQKKDDSEAVPHYVFQRIERGYFYMTVWGSLCFVAYMLKGIGFISRLPYELTMTTFGVLGMLVEDKLIKNYLDKRAVRQMEAADAASSHHDIIMEYIGKNSRITNNECQQITGLGDTQAANILAVLVKEGELEKKGSGRGAFYQKKNGQ